MITIIVNTFMKSDFLTFSFDENIIYTIKDLKREIGKLVNASIDEQTLMIGESFPYPLINNLKLSDLLPEHRSLNLVISENPKKCVPTRLLKNRIISLINMIDSDLLYISNWLYMGYKNIEIDCDNKYFKDAMEEIEECLDIALYDQPLFMKSILFYNYNVFDDNKKSIVSNFNEKIKKQYLCYKNIKLIDQNTMNNI